MTSHIRKWKEAKREEIVKLAKEYPYIAVATLEALPANITAVLRKRLKGNAEIRVAKTRVIRLAFKEAKADAKAEEMINKSVLVIFSKLNPFELFSFVKKNKGSAAAKEGDVADHDILVQAGDTGLPPGPALSILKGAGLNVKVAGPTISIAADKVVAKKGEAIKKEVADVLGKLNIKPMKVGMNILGVYDKNDKMFYGSAVLDVDEEELANKLTTAYQQALNLAVNAEIFNDVSTEIIVAKAEREAKAVNKAIEGAPSSAAQ